MLNRVAFGVRKVLFYVTMGWNRTLGRYFKYDIYGVQVFGIRITPSHTVETLGLNAEQLASFRITRICHGKYYVFTKR